MMSELQAGGRSIEDIAACLRTAPLDPHVVEAIKTAYALGYAVLSFSLSMGILL